ARRPRRWVALGVAAVLVAAGGAAVVVFTGGESTQTKYLESLRAKGQAGHFASDANAVAHAKHVCSTLQSGADQQGAPVDLTAVRFYCPEFVQGFHVLQTITVHGTFELSDTSWLGNSYIDPSIETYGNSCEGSGGYSDIGPGANVT